MASMSAGFRVGIFGKREVSMSRCLWIFWIIVIFTWRETQQSSVIIVRDEKCDPCYRKLLVGKRLSENHVMRSIRCESIEDCHRICEYESTFVCEGFNYGRMQHDRGSRYDAHREGDQGGYNMCQLTSMSGPRMDPRRDFLDDSRYDYYEKDWRCPAEKSHGEFGRLDWSSQPASRRSLPSWHQQPALPSSQSFDPYRRLPNEIPAFFSIPLQPDYHGYTREYLRHRRPYNEISYNQPRPIAPQYLPNVHRDTAMSPQVNYRQFPVYSDRRIGEATNEILPRDWQKPADYSGDWPISRVYGPSYGYQTNRYSGKWLPPKSSSRKSSHEQRYGDRDYNYGPAYGYNHHQPIDSYAPNWKAPNCHKWIGSDGSRDSSVRSATGFKIARRIVEASYLTENLEECEMLCSAHTNCLSFAYRYSLAAAAPTDNCLLSRVNFENLNFYTDLEPDRDYDIYAIIEDSRNCQQGDKRPTSGEVRPHRRPPEECFWRVRSGFGMPPSLTRKELRVDDGLGECQIACISSRSFTCRSFVFRYDSEKDRGTNCFLSDCPTNEVISASGGTSSQNRQAELYERGSYGRGCEAYPFARIYNPANFGKKPQSNRHRGDENCYSGYDGGCKLSPYAVASMTRVDTENECRRQCSRMRHNQHTPCMSFSFKLGDEKRGDNCYLSDVPRRDLRPGLDYTYDDDYVMYAWKELEPQCSSFPGASRHPHSGGFDGTYNDPGAGIYLPQDDSPPHSLRPGTGLISYNNIFLGLRPLDPDRPDPISSPDYPSSLAPHQNDEPAHFSGPGSSTYPDGFGSFNRHYTVNGYPCKHGTKCERNRIVGFWSCEPEGTEFGSWDYCCEPNHHCGFSQGYRYPWCYVGPSEDQWRPCSDKYYPYLPSPRPAVRPPMNHDYRRPNGHDYHRHNDQHYRENRPLTFDKEDSTAYHGRHWPIAFLHPVPPPNCSTDSVALANDRRDDHRDRTNRTKSKTDPIASTSEITPSQSINSSITRLQLHKSHLKRRGLASATNRTRIYPKASNKSKIHRISIIPAISAKSREGEIAQSRLSDHAKFHDNADNYARSHGDSSKFHKNNDNLTTMGVNDFDDFHAENGNFTNGRKNIGLGRIERVTKPTNFDDNKRREDT